MCDLSPISSLFLRPSAPLHTLRNGRHQEEDAGDEAGEGQRDGPRRRLRAAGQGRQPQGREGEILHHMHIIYNIRRKKLKGRLNGEGI